MYEASSKDSNSNYYKSAFVVQTNECSSKYGALYTGVFSFRRKFRWRYP